MKTTPTKKQKPVLGKDFDAWAFKQQDESFAPLTETDPPDASHLRFSKWVRVRFVEVKP